MVDLKKILKVKINVEGDKHVYKISIEYIQQSIALKEEGPDKIVEHSQINHRHQVGNILTTLYG